MEKQEILKEIKEKALENRVPILQDPSLDLIMMVLNLIKPNKKFNFIFEDITLSKK